MRFKNVFCFLKAQVYRGEKFDYIFYNVDLRMLLYTSNLSNILQRITYGVRKTGAKICRKISGWGMEKI